MSTRFIKILFASIALLVAFSRTPSFAEVKDPFDVFSLDDSPDTQLEDDKNKSADELIADANVLLQDERLLDGRSKLLHALQKDPKAYRAHMMLGGYYMVHVGHYRLALRYIKQAMNLFEEKNGPPPYYNYIQRAEHSHLLYLLAQVRLNLDDYDGSLAVLDEYNSYAYQDDWYAGTRAWVLMKLGRIDEAISISRIGLNQGAEAGRTLNMLGILLSMKGDRQSSIDIFSEAIKYELALGKEGAPATPLNNVGEVYKELFLDTRAQNSWLRALSLPDGCEHVLPSLNLAMLLIDELDLKGAKETMDNFLSCVAQFPLRNGEEHRALVHLARGRIDLLSGKTVDALKHFEAGEENRQWFGKIGTDEEDFRVGILLSLGLTLEAQTNQLKSTLSTGITDWLSRQSEIASNQIRSWWYLRRVRQMMTDDLNKMEDLFVRNTDSLIEYPSLGVALEAIEPEVLRKKIELELKDDSRTEAKVFYDQYLGENAYAHGNTAEAFELFNKVLAGAREQDNFLKVRALTFKLHMLDEGSDDYNQLAMATFELLPAALRNAGLKLPVKIWGDDAEIKSLLSHSPFLPVSDEKVPYQISFVKESGQFALNFKSDALKDQRAVRVTGTTLEEMINQLAQRVFSQNL